MKPIRVFISSVRKEFAEVRAGLRDYLRGDPLMRRFLDVFLFEDTPAKDRRADELNLEEVERYDIYVGLFGIPSDLRQWMACRRPILSSCGLRN